METLPQAVFTQVLVTQLVFKAMDALCGQPMQLSSIQGLELIQAERYSSLLQTTVKQLQRSSPERATAYLAAHFSPEQAEVLQQACTLRRQDLTRALLEDVLAQRRLKSFDWNLQLVLSSQHMNQVQEPVLLLELLLDTGLGEDRILLELTRDDLDLFLQRLSALDQRSQRPLETGK